MVVEHDVAAFRDLQGVVAGFGELLEDLTHLLGRADVVAGAVELEAAGVGQPGSRVDAEQGVLGRGILLAHIVRVVGGHQGGIQTTGDLQQILGHPMLYLQPVVHQLDVVVLLAEDVLELPGGPQGLVELAQPQPGLDDARGAAGGGDDPLVIGRQQVLVHARPLADQTLKVCHRRGLDQVDQARVVTGPEGHVGDEAAAGDIVRTLLVGSPVDPALVLAGSLRGHVGLNADDRLDVSIYSRAPKLISPVHVAVVGNGYGRLPQPSHLGNQVRNPAGPVQG